jgi:glycosyltransferase involved in cell wall biosynthesis
VVVDDIVASTPSGLSRYTEELTRELIKTAPEGCAVAGIVSSSPQRDYDRIDTLLPGLQGLFKSALSRRELQVAWQHGLTRVPGGGMVHATSLLAPLVRHDRVNNPGEQTVVTIHDVLPWTHPESMAPRRVSWHKAMAKRAYKYADAVVVPTHSVAEELDGILNFGDRIRVIGDAVSSKLQLPVDAESRAAALGLPERFILTTSSPRPGKGLGPLIQSLTTESDAGLPLVVVGDAGWGDTDAIEMAAEAGLADGRVRALGFLGDADLAVALDRATVFAFPSVAEGFGLPLVEAFHFGTPVVHSDAAAVVEVSAGAGVAVPAGDADLYPDRLAAAISSIATDPVLAERLRYSGLDRAKAFSWSDAAKQVWQLHADL